MSAAVIGDRAGESPARGAALVFGVVTGLGAAMAVIVCSGRPILASRWTLLVELAVWAVVWALGVWAALRLPHRWALLAIVVAGVSLRVAALAGPPTTSDDLYRYAWDGRVQAAGIDPYAQPPAALVTLREPWLWPSPAACARLDRGPGCTRINRPSARTIYPPVAEAWFALVYRLDGIGGRHKPWQVAGLATELGVLALLPVALRRWRRDVRWTALYALSPAPVLEVVNNAHVDGLGVLLLVAALIVVRAPPTRRRDVLVGVLIGAAALVKLYPGIVWVAVCAGIAVGPRWRHALRTAAAAVALAAVTYAPHVLRVGMRVLGYLPGYLREERYHNGGRFLLASALRIPGSLAGAATALGVGLVIAWLIARRAPPPRAAAVLLGAALLAVSPVQPWYAVALLAMATVAGAPAWSAVVVAGYPYFFAVILNDRHAAGHGQLAYGIALGAVALAAIARPRVTERSKEAMPCAWESSAAPVPTNGPVFAVPSGLSGTRRSGPSG